MTTELGRVVYDREKHFFKMGDVLRIVKKMNDGDEFELIFPEVKDSLKECSKIALLMPELLQLQALHIKRIFQFLPDDVREVIVKIVDGIYDVLEKFSALRSWIDKLITRL